MYRVQYLCLRLGPQWQDLTEGWVWKTPRMFQGFEAARMTCNGLLWQYHSARVIDPQGQVVYSI
jgi:hypothetical protein